MDQISDILRGRYKIIKEISRGGMGAVYLAEDLLKDCRVAVKKSFFSGQKQAQKGFEIEAKLLARLEHAGLPKVLDYFITEKNVQTLVMDFVGGETLEDILESGSFRVGSGLNSERVLDWALQILDILRYLHNFDPPVIHRDIKPNNIKLTRDGKIVLLDFGLAKSLTVTVVGGMSGYSPIEQVQQTGTDPRSDIYALGTSLFHLLTDRHPLTATERFRKLYGADLPADEKESRPADPQPAVAEFNPHVPSAVSGIVAKAMALMPADRFQSADEMKGAILEVRRELEQNRTRQIASNFVQQTNFDALNDWEKAKPLIDENEASLGNWSPAEKNAEPSTAEKDSMPSFIPSKIGEISVDSQYEPTKNAENDLRATVSSTALFGKEIETAPTRPSFFAGFSPATDATEDAIKTPITGPIKRPRSTKKGLFLIAAGVLTVVFIVATGTLAWYLMPRPASPVNPVEQKNTVEIPAAPPPIKEANPIQISTYRVEKNGQTTLLEENHRFAPEEKFKFNVKSPQDGFLYIISRNNRDEVVIAYSSRKKETPEIKKDSEQLFPPDNVFRFEKNDPSEASAYFVIVQSYKDDLAKRIENILGNGTKKMSSSDVRELMADLEKSAKDSEKNERAAVKILTIRKRD